MQFDHIKLNEKGSLALLLEDLLISELCPLEENASHHIWAQTTSTAVNDHSIYDAKHNSWSVTCVSHQLSSDSHVTMEKLGKHKQSYMWQTRCSNDSCLR